MHGYYLLNFVRKPEHMGWTNYRSTTFTELSHWAHGDEAQRRLKAFDRLQAEAEAIGDRLPPEYHDAYFELVLYPLRGAANMNRKVLYAEKSRSEAMQGLPVANTYAQRARKAHEQIQIDTDRYNNDIADGKWRHMMVANPRRLPVFAAPSVAELSVEGEPRLVVRAEGSAVAASRVGGDTATETEQAAMPIVLTVDDARVVEPMAKVETPRGAAATLPQDGEEVVQDADGPARVVFDFEVAERRTYFLEIEANHPSDTSDSWFIKLDDHDATLFNDEQTEGSFAWLRVSELQLSPGEHQLTFVAREDGAELRRVRLIPAGQPAVLSTRR